MTSTTSVPGTRFGPPADQEQRNRIITDTDRTLFVEAGAGSGKTRSLVERVRTLVIDHDVPLRHIAVVTFTNKAAAELRDRLRTDFQQLRRRPLAAEHDRERATAALEDLDTASIGTLHSFAQQLLALHPIEAGLPPVVEVLDELSESMVLGQQWEKIRDHLLGDPDLNGTLHIALDAGMRLDDLQSLAQRLTADWDLIEDRIPLGPPRPMTAPDVSALVSEARLLAARVDECADPADRFAGRLAALRDWSDSAATASTPGETLQLLQAAERLKWSYGKKGNWPDLAGLRAECQDWQGRANEARARMVDAMIRLLVTAVARMVLAEADARAAAGRLTYQDLLVRARKMLTAATADAARVRASLQDRYRVLMLDEFQDTDPIQLELAVRIAGGAGATAESWTDVTVPPGALFVVGDPKQSIYRFRRASIATYLRAQRHLGETVALSTNFRTIPAILTWVNAVFATLITPAPDAQPHYLPLRPYRDGAGRGAAVTVLGANPHDKAERADDMRRDEAADVAAVIRQALDDGWTVFDDATESWRPITPADIAILVPTGTSIPTLVDALDAAGLSHRATAHTSAYESQEVRDLLAALRAIADPTDELSTVTALRSPLFGCGDDDLWRFAQAGGRFTPRHRVPDSLANTPAGTAIAALGRLHRRARGAPVSELLGALITDRRMVELAATGDRPREVWRHLRFVVDQARAWSEAEHGTLRGYLDWATQQSDHHTRVREPSIPETDVDAVTISTVHRAKGLEYGMVVLSGMSSGLPGSRPPVLWPDHGGVAVRVRAGLETRDYARAHDDDQHLAELELRRLLYVATTRARDHLVVSTHRSEPGPNTATTSRAQLLVDAGALTAPDAHHWTPAPAAARGTAAPARPPTLPTWHEFAATRDTARAHAARPAAISASSLEGTGPDSTSPDGAGAPQHRAATTHPTPRDHADDPTAPRTTVGLAVHAVLQRIDLARYADAAQPREDQPCAVPIDAACAELIDAACAEHEVTADGDRAAVAALVASALASPIVARAAGLEHWRETWVAATGEDGTVTEGIIDLLYRDGDGCLTVVDYKTDQVPRAAINTRATFYRPQLAAYLNATRAATGARVSGMLLFLRSSGPAIEVPIN